MRRTKRIGILSGILAAACLATFGVIQFEEHKEQIKNSDEVILELSGDSVKSLSWEYESETLAFHKEEKWLYDEDENFPVDEEKISGLLQQFQEFGVSFIIEDVEDYGQYGLDDPVCSIHLETEDQSYEILLGNYSNMDSERYVSIGDGNVYLVKNDPLDSFDAVLSDMIAHDETPSFDRASEITFTGTETYSIVYEEDSNATYCSDDVYFARKDGKDLPLDTSRVERYLSNITDIGLTDYVTYNASEEELETYGLKEPELTVAVDYRLEDEDGEETSDTFVLNISRDPKEKEPDGETDKEDNDDEGEEEITAYARVGNSQIIYRISSETYKGLTDVSYDSLRHLEVLSADFADIHQIDISLEGEVYTINSEKNDGENTWYYQEEELEIADLKNAIENLNADSFTDEKPEKKEEIGLTVYLDNENYPEIPIQIYRYDGEHCLAVVNGEPVCLIRRSDVVSLIEAVHAIVLNEQ